jgi:hypothetical protein
MRESQVQRDGACDQKHREARLYALSATVPRVATQLAYNGIISRLLLYRCRRGVALFVEYTGRDLLGHLFFFSTSKWAILAASPAFLAACSDAYIGTENFTDPLRLARMP